MKITVSWDSFLLLAEREMEETVSLKISCFYCSIWKCLNCGTLFIFHRWQD